MNKIDKNRVKKFSEATSLILDEVRDIRGEKDEEIRLIDHLLSELEKSEKNGHLENFMSSLPVCVASCLDIDVKRLNSFLQLKRSMLASYRITHIRDTVNELIRATASAGFSLFVSDGVLFLGMGNACTAIERWEIKNFILQKFFPVAKVDMRNQTVRGRDEVVDNLYALVDVLVEEKLKGK